MTTKSRTFEQVDDCVLQRLQANSYRLLPRGSCGAIPVSAKRMVFGLTRPPGTLPLPAVTTPYPLRSTSDRQSEVLRRGYGEDREG
jgi:hypothetical protein